MRDVLERVRGRLAVDGVAFDPLPHLAADVADSSGRDGVYFAALHDDVVLASADEAKLRAAIVMLRAALAEVGLMLGAKSVLVADGDVGHDLRGCFERGAVRVTKCAGAPLWVPGAEAEAGALLKALAAKLMDPLRTVGVGHPQDVVRVPRHAGPWTRLAYMAAVTPGFGDEWLQIADDAHRLTAKLLKGALGEQASKASKVALLAAYTPTAKGGLGIPAPLVEVTFLAERFDALVFTDDPATSKDDVDEHLDGLRRRRDVGSTTSWAPFSR